MPICVACGSLTAPPLCDACRAQLRPGGSFFVGSAPGRYALHHSGTGRALVHQLKYRGVVGAADLLAPLMARLIPSRASVLVPLPRATIRRIAYGVDPAGELARRIGRHTGIPVSRLVRPGLWWPRHAGRNPTDRRSAHFRAAAPPAGAVLVDDVVTSGATVLGALAAFGELPPGHIASVIAATSPGMIGLSKASIASGRPRVNTTVWQSKVAYGPGRAVRNP